MQKHYVEIIKTETGEIANRSGPYFSEMKAMRQEDVRNVNLDHDRYYTRLASVDIGELKTGAYPDTNNA